MGGYWQLSPIGTQPSPLAWQLCDSSVTLYRIPNKKRPSARSPMAACLQRVTADTKEILCQSVHREESLGQSRGLEPPTLKSVVPSNLMKTQSD